MLPTSRCIGGIARQRDLRVISKSTGAHLERSKTTLSLSAETNTLPLLDGEFSHESESFRVPQSFGCIPKGSVEVIPAGSSVLSLGSARRRSTSIYSTDASVAPPSSSQFSSQQIRGFHTSPRVPYDSTSYNVTEVPEFFVKYKEQRATPVTSGAYGRGHEELGLMQPLTHSILSGDVVATTRRLKAKIPVEHHIEEGHIVHPSGFVVPGPGHTSTSDVARAKEKERDENVDRAIQTAAVAHRVLESDYEHVNATTLPSSHKVPFEVREPDGTIKHPSGFVPPTPAHKFRYPVNMVRDRKSAAARQKARQPSPIRGVLRAVHTSVPNASEGC